MSSTHRPATRTRCLAEVRTGETVRIERILFEMLKDLCCQLGLDEGDVVRCSWASRARMVVESPDGRTASMKTDWGRFIEVSTMPAEVDAGGAAADREGASANAEV